MEDGKILRLVTRTEVEQAAVEASIHEDHAAAIQTLEGALELAKERGAVGVAVAFLFENGDYGHMAAPGRGAGALAGAVADMQFCILRGMNP